MKQTDRPFPVFLPSVSSLSFSYLVPSTPFRSDHPFCLLRLKSRRTPGASLRFRFPFRSPRSVLFPFTTLGHFSNRPRPRREGMYLTPTPANTPQYDKSVCVYPRNLTHGCACLLPRSLFVFSNRPRPRREDLHTFPSLRSHTPLPIRRIERVTHQLSYKLAVCPSVVRRLSMRKAIIQSIELTSTTIFVNA